MSKEPQTPYKLVKHGEWGDPKEGIGTTWEAIMSRQGTSA